MSEMNYNGYTGMENNGGVPQPASPYSSPYDRSSAQPAVQPVMQNAQEQTAMNMQNAQEQTAMNMQNVQEQAAMNVQNAQEQAAMNVQNVHEQAAVNMQAPQRDPQPAHTPAAGSQQAFRSPYGYTQSASTPAPAAYTPNDFKPKKKNGKRWALSVAAICAALVISGGSFYAGAVYNNSNTTVQTTASTAQKVAAANTVSVSGDGTEVSSTITEVVEQAMPSMVAINTVTEESMSFANPFYYYMFGDDYNQTYETNASGSGIIIAQYDTELLIVTNNHVVEGADKIAVQFIDDESYDATVKGTSADNDLAVLAVNISDISADTLGKIKVATLGSSENLKLGEPAIAIGNSLGYGQSVTVGYISAVEREVQISDNTMTLIQTDAAINPGNSGGALLNIKGEVIGINSAKYSDTSVEGTGYAIPISDAEPVINDLMSEDHVSDEDKPYLGVYGQSVPDSYKERFDWPEGVYVVQVTENSPAALAGLREGDIITDINGEKVETMEALKAVLEECKVGDKITLGVTRSDRNNEMKSAKLTATLISRGDAGIEE